MRTRVRSTRAGMLLLIVIFSMGVAVPPVAAHYVYQNGRVAHYGNNCAWNRSEISHGTNDGGYSRVDLSFDSDTQYASCASLYNTWDKAKMTLVLGFSSNGTTNWGPCVDLGSKTFTDNTYYAYKKTWEKYWSRPCGKGYYRTMGGVYGYKDAQWHGGLMNSTSHYLSP